MTKWFLSTSALAYTMTWLAYMFASVVGIVHFSRWEHVAMLGILLLAFWILGDWSKHYAER